MHSRAEKTRSDWFAKAGESHFAMRLQLFDSIEEDVLNLKHTPLPHTRGLMTLKCWFAQYLTWVQPFAAITEFIFTVWLKLIIHSRLGIPAYGQAMTTVKFRAITEMDRYTY